MPPIKIFNILHLVIGVFGVFNEFRLYDTWIFDPDDPMDWITPIVWIVIPIIYGLNIWL